MGTCSTKKARRTWTRPFIQLPHWVYDSAAFRSLKPGPRTVLLALIRRYNGSNNGRIGLGVREAMTECCVRDKDTISSYFQSLEQKGLIVKARAGGFNMKDATRNRATEWRLTWWPAPEVGAGVTKEFQIWLPTSTEEDHGPDFPCAESGSFGRSSPGEGLESCFSGPDRELSKIVSPDQADTYISKP